MPGGLDVTLNPLLNSLDILIRVLELITSINTMSRQGLDLVGLALRLIKRLSPATVLDARTQVTGQGILVGGLEVHVPCARLRVIREKGVHVSHLSGVGVHTAGRLARLDVTPDHGDHVSLVVHEAGVKIGRVVGVGRLDVGGSTREGILEEMEHGEEVSGGHDHVVAEPASNNGVVHDWLVGLVLKVRLPAVLEVWSGPFLKLGEFLGSRANLDACFNAIGGKGTGALDVPLIKDA